MPAYFFRNNGAVSVKCPFNFLKEADSFNMDLIVHLSTIAKCFCFTIMVYSLHSGTIITSDYRFVRIKSTGMFEILNFSVEV